MLSFLAIVKPAAQDVVIEPSAGAGDFTRELRARAMTVKSYDTAPDDPAVTKQDFLRLNVPLIAGRYHVVGNPPFSLVTEFIQRAATFASSIAFILPLSFAKSARQQTVPAHFHLSYAARVPLDAFYYGNTAYDVPCVWQVWQARPTDRPEPEQPPQPRGYCFVRDTEPCNVSIVRAGFYAGRVSCNIPKVRSSNNRFFIATDTADGVGRIQLAEPAMLAFDCQNTGPRSLTKGDVIRIINEYMDA